MRQYLLPENTGKTYQITGKDFHYLRDVLRLKSGDSFTGINKKGESFKLVIIEEDDNYFIIDSEKLAEKPENGNIKLILYQCLPKARKMDLIVRQAAETGVSRIVPVTSTNTVTKLNENTATKLKRWKRIVKEALQQSGSEIFTEIDEPVNLNELKNTEKSIKLLFHQEELKKNTLMYYLQNGLKQVNLSSIIILVGPEGGFTKKEIEELFSYGFKPVYFGREVLRVETAALYAIASVKTLLLELKNQEVE